MTNKNKYHRNKKNEKSIEAQKRIVKEKKIMTKNLKKLKIKIVDNIFELSLKEYKEYNKTNGSSCLEFKKRIALNYIRHTLTNYIEIIKAFKNTTDYEKSNFKKLVNIEIKKKYLELV